ncbi:MAG: FecR domain-containing protein, partial [Fuerstiella sp.]
MSDVSNEPDFIDLVAVWHGNRDLPAARRELLLKRLAEDEALRDALAREIQMAGLTRIVQSGEPRWLRLDEKLDSSTASDHSAGTEDAVMAAIAERMSAPRPERSKSRQLFTLAMVVGIFVVGSLAGLWGWMQRPVASTFVVIEQSKNARWESSDLPTSDGTRLGSGTLRLSEGLAILRFDSGAQLIMEAPTELTLIDAMHCELTRGTAVADIPESDQGFRITTPSADVVDYGTRFAVSFHEETGETHTQVMEGRVEVKHARSGEVVELKTGERITVAGEELGLATDGFNEGYRTMPVPTLERAAGWVSRTTVKDAYTGHVNGHESDVLLYVKQGLREDSPHRQAYLGFQLAGVQREHIAAAELSLYFSPTGWGLASHVPDATFSVYGMTANHAQWNEDILRNEYFGQPDLVHLGSFV